MKNLERIGAQHADSRIDGLAGSSSIVAGRHQLSPVVINRHQLSSIVID
jgi:hypothetical protein